MPDIRETETGVRELQTMLRVLSVFDTRIPPLVSDGVFGEETVAAVRVFQAIYGLPPTGEIDTQTWNAITEAYQSTLRIQSRGNAVYPLVHPETLAKPLSESFIETVQVLLRAISPLMDFSPPVSITGSYNEATASAVAVLQSLHGLQTTGELDLPTWNVLADTFNLEMQKMQADPPIKAPT